LEAGGVAIYPKEKKPAKGALYEGPLLLILLSTLLLLAMPVREVQGAFDIHVSTDKYEYVLGESVSILFFISIDCEVKLVITGPDQSTLVYGPHVVSAGTHSVATIAWTPLGPRRVVLEGGSKGLKRNAACYFIVANERCQELYSTPAGAWTHGGIIYNSSLLLLSIDFDLSGSGDQQATSAYPGEIVSMKVLYWVWTPSTLRSETVRWQLFLFCSWTPQWPPPSSHYFLMYDATPGGYPGTQGANVFSISAPMCPGVYYLWFACSLNASSEHAVSNFKTPMTLPAHAKIVVRQRQPSAITLDVSPSSIALGKDTTLSGNLNVTPSEGARVQIWYSMNTTTFSRLIEVAIDSYGRFSYRWTPPSIGTYFIKASWDGDLRCGRAESKVIELTVTEDWTHFPQLERLQQIAGVAATGGSVVLGWLFKTRKRRFVSGYLAKIDAAYNEYSMNPGECKKLLAQMRHEVLQLLKKGKIDEAQFVILDTKLTQYTRDLA